MVSQDPRITAISAGDDFEVRTHRPFEGVVRLGEAKQGCQADRDDYEQHRDQEPCGFIVAARQRL